ncbi:MAG: type II toxin-antitoxin system prevent-host-death family antitoxin [Sphingomonadaceae bacterium]|jgi:prevent-host-death family protein|nr:type II toxin-antitoxin system prevent-host-death family antitoxin [Sphingomonadaceae bacterium]
MDRAITATDANQHFSELLRDVQDGSSFVVMSRGRAVARVIPVEKDGQRAQMETLGRFLQTLPQRSAGHWTREDLYR